jgi:hypothetical protein
MINLLIIKYICKVEKKWNPLRIKYDKQDQQGKAAFKECNPHTTQQQEP